MSFAADPAVLRMEAALGCERKAARAVVRALVTVAPRAMPWIDAEDVEVTTGRLFAGEPLLGALVRARLVEETAAGIVLTSEGERLREILDEERAAAAERKRASREMQEVVTFCDQRVTSRDIGVTFRSAAGEISSNYGDADGTNRDAEGVASQITRVAGARGNLPPPTPSTAETLASPNLPASPDSSTPDTADIPSLGRWLHATLRRNGFTGPSKLDSNQQSELLDAIRAGLPPDVLAGILRQAADNGARKMSWLRVGIERELGDLAYRAPERREAVEASRAPPVFPLPTDPIPIGEARLLREHRESEGEYEW